MTRSRNRRLRLIPSHLPLIRDKLVEYERVALKEEMAAHSQYERSMEAAWNFADNRCSAGSSVFFMLEPTFSVFS